jgi:hypothetical protein
MTDKEANAASPHAFTPRSRPVTVGKVIVWGALGLLLYVAHVAFIPLALALLFGLVLSAPVEALHKIRVPRSLSAALITSTTCEKTPAILAHKVTRRRRRLLPRPQPRQKAHPRSSLMWDRARSRVYSRLSSSHCFCSRGVPR